MLLKFPTVILLITIADVYSRVPMPPNSFQAFRRQAIIQHQPIIHHQTIIQHPPVITRTTGKTTNNATVVTSSATTTTSTTPEPTEAPEIDDDYIPNQRTAIIRGVYNNNYLYNYNYAPTTYGYDYYGLGLGYNNMGLAAGGISREVEDFIPPAKQQQQQKSQPPRQTKSVPATTVRTTKTTVTPEPDDDMITSPTTGKTATHSQETYTGYCFCSPLSQCPVDSMPRGGLCHNFLAYFMNLKFIRCCYSPSVARSFQL